MKLNLKQKVIIKRVKGINSNSIKLVKFMIRYKCKSFDNEMESTKLGIKMGMPWFPTFAPS